MMDSAGGNHRYIVVAWNARLERFDSWGAPTKADATRLAANLPKWFETPTVERAEDFDKHPAWRGDNPKGRKMATKKPSAAQVAARKLFAARVKAGEFGGGAKKRKANPLTRVRVNSPSMATGEAPSKRLVKRRKKTAKAPAGYYANPTRQPADSESLHVLLQYYVQWLNPVSGKWRTIAAFTWKNGAAEYARAFANTSAGRDKTIRVYELD